MRKPSETVIGAEPRNPEWGNPALRYLGIDPSDAAISLPEIEVARFFLAFYSVASTPRP